MGKSTALTPGSNTDARARWSKAADRCLRVTWSMCLALSVSLTGCAVSGMSDFSSHAPPATASPIAPDEGVPVEMGAPPPPPPPAPAFERDGGDGADGPNRVRHSPAVSGAANAERDSNSTAGVSEGPAASPTPGSGDQRVFCEITGKFMPMRACEEAKTIAANARQGLGAVEYPDTITRGETRMVSFTVRRAAAGESLPVPGSSASAGQPFALKITGRMAALLKGEGFKIEPDKLQYRDIGISDAARWEWNITALKAPHHHLTLTAYMVVEAPDGSTTESAIIPSKEMDIPVRVTIPQWFSDITDAVVSLSNSAKAMIVALMAVVVALMAFRAKVAELIGSPRRDRADQKT